MVIILIIILYTVVRFRALNAAGSKHTEIVHQYLFITIIIIGIRFLRYIILIHIIFLLQTSACRNALFSEMQSHGAVVVKYYIKRPICK